MQKRKLTIAAAATAIALAASTNAEGQHIRTAFNARPVVSAPIVPTMPIIISPSQWTTNNPMLKPMLSVLPAAPIPVVAPAPTISAIPAVLPRAAIPIAVPAASPVAIPVEVPLSQAAPAVQQSVLHNVFDGMDAKGDAKDIGSLVSEIQSQIKAQAARIGQGMSAHKSRPHQAELGMNESMETDDYSITLVGMRATPDGMGAAVFRVRNKHSKEQTEIIIMNEQIGQFSIVDVSRRVQKIFAVKVTWIGNKEVSVEVNEITQTEIYTMAPKERTEALEVGGGSELGNGGFDVVQVKGDKVLLHFGHGEIEFNKWFTVGKARIVRFEEEDYHEEFSIEVVRVSSEGGKQTVELRITELS